MRPVIQILLLLFVLSSLTNCKKNDSDILYDKKYIKQINAARKEMVFYLSRNKVPGASVAIMKDGKLIYSEAMGLASKDLEVPATRETKFRIGEISELFTSFIYFRMIEDGTLHPDSSIQYYMPDFPIKKHRIRLNDLAYQVSGIRNPHSEEIEWRGLNVTLQKGLEQFKNDSLLFTPGKYQTNNFFHYNLLGAIMEKATDKQFNQILKEYVTDTLKLSQTKVDNPFITIKGRTDFYDHNFISQNVNATTRDMRYRAPSQGLLSSAEDVVKFGNAVINSNLLSEESKAKMFEPTILYDNIPSKIAHGWLLLSDRSGNVMYGRSGAVTGCNSSILVYPDLDLIIACVTNLNTGINESPIFDMAKHFIHTQEGQSKEKE